MAHGTTDPGLSTELTNRARYRQLARHAGEAGLHDVAARYQAAAFDIGLSEDELAVRVEGDVAKVTQGVQELAQWGPKHVLEGLYGREAMSALEIADDASVPLFNALLPDVTEAVLREAYVRLGITNTRANAVPIVDGMSQTFSMVGQGGIRFEETRTNSGAGQTFTELSASLPKAS